MVVICGSLFHINISVKCGPLITETTNFLLNFKCSKLCNESSVCIKMLFPVYLKILDECETGLTSTLEMLNVSTHFEVCGT